MILITKTNQNKVLILPHLFLTVPVTIPIISQSEIVNKITNTRMFMNTHTPLTNPERIPTTSPSITING
jgi:hypothetical protein